eukprot:TRINITY_DN9434_c0_g3_i2.p1 TRINITY_DN9434_c0_g3~~TRINITY_DN9434_c0_g3_i2.p1  ORF type:complete len:282 (+),score=69.91 TRINITY_DN9434_c0_g3_i2:394-1239(+)
MASLLALLEDVDVPTDEPPQPHTQDADAEQPAEGDDEDDGDNDDDDNEDEYDDDLDLEAELDAELEAEQGEPDANDEEEEGGDDETVNEDAAPDSVPQTPHSEQDDDKIGEDDIEDDDDHSTLDRGSHLYHESGAAAKLPDDVREEFIKQQRRDITEKDERDAIEKAQMQERARRESRIVEHLDGIQMERYEKFRRSTIKNRNMKKLAETIVGRTVHPNVIQALCGVTKMHIGEVVETARILADRSGHYGALMPIHVHEAYQLMQMENRLPARKRHKRLFR